MERELRPPIRATSRLARKYAAAPTASPIATSVGPDVASPSSASSNATLEISAPAPKPSTAPTMPSLQERATPRIAPSTSEDAARAPQPTAESMEEPRAHLAPVVTPCASALGSVEADLPHAPALGRAEKNG